MRAHLKTRPVGPADLADLAALFASERTTRRCWCMAFCVPRGQFAVGWLTGGNRRQFAARVTQHSSPMGILAADAGTPVGWCACGPRSRYAAAVGPHSTILGSRDPAEAETVWLLPCVFVRAGSRGQGVTHALVQAAVALAGREGARAIEGWPLAEDETRPADAFLGREQVFADLGFHRVAQPRPGRVLMRLDLVKG